MISFNEFKEIDLRVGKVKEVQKNSAVVDLGEKQVECNCSNAEVQPNEQVVVAVKEGSAMLLAVKDAEGKYKVLTAEGDIAPGTKVE